MGVPTFLTFSFLFFLYVFFNHVFSSKSWTILENLQRGLVHLPWKFSISKIFLSKYISGQNHLLSPVCLNKASIATKQLFYNSTLLIWHFWNNTLFYVSKSPIIAYLLIFKFCCKNLTFWGITSFLVSKSPIIVHLAK